MTDCGHEHEDGAYVLGALSPEERVAFERHLPDCAECARSVRELAGLPGLLARVPVEIVDPEQEPLPVPETLLPAVVRQVRQSQRRRRWVTSALVAAAATIAIGAVGVATLGGHDDHAPPQAAPAATAAPVELHPLGSEAISGWVSLTQVGWGTRLDLTCSYDEEGSDTYHDQPPPTYTMFVTRSDGSTEQVASWKGLPGKTMHLAAATSTDAGDIADVQVRSGDQTVLELS
jgi:hypothetical protein